MKKNNRKRIMVGLSIVLLAVVIIGIGRSFAKPNNTLKNQKVDGLSFENASIEYDDKLSTFTVDVYNENNYTYDLSGIDIILENKKDGKATLNYDIESLEADEGIKIIIDKIDYDLSSYTKVSYKINK